MSAHICSMRLAHWACSIPVGIKPLTLPMFEPCSTSWATSRANWACVCVRASVWLCACMDVCDGGGGWAVHSIARRTLRGDLLTTNPSMLAAMLASSPPGTTSNIHSERWWRWGWWWEWCRWGWWWWWWRWRRSRSSTNEKHLILHALLFLDAVACAQASHRRLISRWPRATLLRTHRCTLSLSHTLTLSSP